MKLSETAAVLREIRVSPVKSLGQNFLHDRNLSRWIVDQIQATAQDYIVEIGPGLGALTGFLLESGARVLAIEKDARLVEFLRSHFSSDRLEVRHADALETDVREFFTKPAVKLIGNLPYYISSQLLLKFLEYPSPISLAVLMLQKEMADRLSASPSKKEYGALTVLLQRHYQIDLLRKVPTAVFVPRPEVDSAIIRIIPRGPSEFPEHEDQLLEALVRRGFSQRRKQLGPLLRDYISNWLNATAALGFDRQVRAETLSVEQWIALANYVQPIVDPTQANQTEERFPVVDDLDRVLYDAPRSKVHGNNSRHRAVHVLVFNQKGEVFLQKRSWRKDRHPGLWDTSAAGHVLAGEEYDVAAQRELKEELGITGTLGQVAQLPASDRTGQEFIRLYETRCQGPLVLNRAEIETGRYFPPEIVTGWIAARPDVFTPGFIECWKVYAENRR